MKIYNYDPSGFYVSSGSADESPLEPGVFAIPGMATTIEPPTTKSDQAARWTGEQWEVIDIPTPKPPEPPTNEQIDAMRVTAYSHPLTGSDRLFAKSMRMQMTGTEGWEGVVTTAEKVFGEIQARYPKN